MKIRNDFVTNSSSSSFIIGNKGDKEITVQLVYELLRDMYFEIIKRFVRCTERHPEFGIKFNTDTNKFEWTDRSIIDLKIKGDYLGDDDAWHRYYRHQENVFRIIGLEEFDTDNYWMIKYTDFEWLKFETYEDAINSNGVNLPFYWIEDFSDCKDTGEDSYAYDEMLEYFCREDEELDRKYDDAVKRCKNSKEICLNILGKVGVYGEHGQIPLYAKGLMKERFKLVSFFI